MSRTLRGLQIFSGNTILGDGRVIMIIDVLGVLKSIGMKESHESGAAENDSALSGTAAGKENLLLLFKTKEDTLKAAPIEKISRLEEVDLERIEYSNGRAVIQYLGHLMPVFNYDKNSDCKGKKPLIIFKNDKMNVGFLAEQILDIAKYFGSYADNGSNEVLDSVIINSKAADIINPGWYTERGIVISAAQ